MNNNSLRFRIILIVVTPIFDAHLVFFLKTIRRSINDGALFKKNSSWLFGRSLNFVSAIYIGFINFIEVALEFTPRIFNEFNKEFNKGIVLLEKF